MKHTLLDEHLFVVDDTDVFPGQVADLTTLYLPQFVGYL